MDAKTLSEAMGGSLPLAQYERLLPGLEEAMHAANINTSKRAAMYLAQIGHESSGLRHMEEIADGSAYNGNRDLGNIYPGDGPRFKGRGPIQLTGRNHYRAFTKWAREKGHSTIDFEAEPHRLSEPKWGFLAATYYWVVSRPNLNRYADNGDIFSASCDINGWIKLQDGAWRTPNGYQDRVNRYNRCLRMGDRILPGRNKEGGGVMEIMIDYPRDQVGQDTFYNCGPASVQTAIRGANGKFFTEVELGVRLRTHRGGTDYIGQFPAVLNHYIPGAKYKFEDVPNYLDSNGKDRVWDRVVNSVGAGHGVIVNIVAPPSNYPKAVSPSTISPAYSGGTVYHYFAVMGVRIDNEGRKVWVADSGFSPYGYWLSFEQLLTLMVPKGYAYSTSEPKAQFKMEGSTMTVLSGVSAAALNDAKLAAQEANAKIDKVIELNQAILTETRVTAEQFAGPDRDKKGNLLWRGWKGTSSWPGTGGKATVEALIVRLDELSKQNAEVLAQLKKEKK